jgi:hypothetical protein
MPTLKERIVELLGRSPGLTDREITDAVIGRGALQQPINQACRDLERRGALSRRPRPDGLIGNFLPPDQLPATSSPPNGPESPNALSEDSVKRAVERWLRASGWEPRIAWGASRGIDIEARRSTERWIIEAKGRGKSPQEQGNYFLNGLAELLQRMDDPAARYSLAFPDLPRYRGLWERLPSLVKARLQLTMLFVDEEGNVREFPCGSDAG